MTRDIPVALDDVGTGPPVVFLHGLAEDRQSWAPQMADLTGRRRIAVDLRGHGESPLGQPDGTLAQLTGDLIDLLESLEQPAACVGFSLGGTVVLDTAAQRPDLVDHAVVVGTSSVVGRTARQFFADRAAAAEAGDLDRVAGLLHEDTRAQLHTEADLDQVVSARLRAIGNGRGYANAARAMLDLADHPLTPRLASVKCHVDVVGGQHDVVCPRKAAELLLAGLTDATYHELSGAGHLMAIDAPDRLTQLLDRLLRKDTP